MAVTTGYGKIFGRGNTFSPLSSTYADVASVTQFVDYANTYGWVDFEPTAGNYDFSKLGTDLDYAFSQGHGKKVEISLPWASFNSKARLCPSHVGGAGVGYVEAQNGARIVRLWDSAIRTKYKNLLTALGTYIAGHAHGNLVSCWGGSETAASNFGGEGVSASTWQAALLDLHTHACSALAIPVRILAQWSLQSLEQYIRDCVAAGVEQIGGPDIDPFNGGLYTNMLLIASLADELGVAVHYNFEFSNYLPQTGTRSFTFPPDYVDSTWAGVTVSNTVGNAALNADFFIAVINYAVNVGHCKKISILPRSGSSTAGEPDLGFTDGWIPAVQDSRSTAIFPYGGSAPPPPPPPPSTSLFEIKATRKALPTSTGAFAMPHGCASAPKAVFLHSDTAEVEDTNTNGSSICFGAADGTRQWAVTLRANTGATSSNYCARRGMTDQSLAKLLSGSSNVDGEMAFSSFDATNVNFTCGNAWASAFLANMLAVAGDGASAYAPKVSLTTQNTAAAVTPGWTLGTGEVIVGLVVTTDFTWDDSGANGGAHSLGLFTYDGSTMKQMCRSSRTVDATYNTSLFGNLHSTRIGQIIATGGTETFAVEVSADATTVSFTPRNGNANADIGVFMIKLSSAEANLIVDNLPIAADLSGGLYSHNVAQATDFAIFLNTLLTATDSIASDATAGVFGLSLVAPNQSYTIQSTRQDNVATTNCRSRAAQKPVYLYEHSGSTKHYDATMSSVTSPADKITLAYGTIVPTTRTKAIIMAIARVASLQGSSTAVTVPATIDLSSYTDYVRFGIGSATGIERRADGGNQITYSYDTAAGLFTGGSTNYPQFSGTNSAPSGAFPASAARPYWTQAGDQFVLTFPAGSEEATASVWVNASGVDIDVTAEISDGSASDYTVSVDSADTTSGNINRRRIDVTYSASQNGETLTITLEIAASNAVGGNMSVQAAALVNNYIPVNDPPSYPFGYPYLIGFTETAPDVYSADFGVRLSEGGTVFNQARLATNTAAPEPQQVENGTDGDDDDTDIVDTDSSSIDQGELVTLTLEGLDAGTDYFADFAAKDNTTPSALYTSGTISIAFTTPDPDTGGGGGEGTFTGTTGILVDNDQKPLGTGQSVLISIYDSGDTNSPHTALPDQGPLPGTISNSRLTLTYGIAGDHWVRITDNAGNECWSGTVTFA